LVIEGKGYVYDPNVEGSNPAGHTAAAVSDQGLASFGTVDPVGGSTTDYLPNQAKYRESELTLIKAIPEQDAAFWAAFNAARARGYDALTNNCATAVNEGLTAAGIPGDLGPLNSIPGIAGMRAKAASSQQNGGANPTTVRIPEGGSATPAVSRFNPK
jgi:hypothetical protein